MIAEIRRASARLKHSAFFFEEIGNGTRLRIVSAQMSQEELGGKIGLSIMFGGRTETSGPASA